MCWGNFSSSYTSNEFLSRHISHVVHINLQIPFLLLITDEVVQPVPAPPMLTLAFSISHFYKCEGHACFGMHTWPILTRCSTLFLLYTLIFSQKEYTPKSFCMSLFHNLSILVSPLRFLRKYIITSWILFRSFSLTTQISHPYKSVVAAFVLYNLSWISTLALFLKFLLTVPHITWNLFNFFNVR